MYILTPLTLRSNFLLLRNVWVFTDLAQTESHFKQNKIVVYIQQFSCHIGYYFAVLLMSYQKKAKNMGPVTVVKIANLYTN
jgi:hypothetical protein